MTDQDGHADPAPQARLAAAIVDVFVYVVVLNLFVEYLPRVISETFTVSLLTAVLLKVVLEGVLLAKKRVVARFRKAATPLGKVVAAILVWAVVFGSKFLVLEVVDVVFGDRVSLGGFLSVTLLILTLLLARAGVRRLLDVLTPVGPLRYVATVETERHSRGAVVRAGESYEGKQGPQYTPGVSAESVGARALWLGSVTLPPDGGRTKAHVHENHESGFYLVSGEEVELWTGDELEHREVARAGDYLYIPAGVPHVAVNRSAVPAVFVGARTDPNEQESVVMRPDLEGRVP